MLNESGESGHTCFVADHRGKTFSLSSLNMMFAVVSPHMTFIMLRYFPPIPNLSRVLSWKKVILCKMLFDIYCDDLKILIFHSMNVVITYWIVYVELSLHSRNKSHLVMVMILLICCWIWFDSMLLIFLYLYSSWILFYSSFFLVVSLSDFGIRVMLAL